MCVANTGARHSSALHPEGSGGTEGCAGPPQAVGQAGGRAGCALSRSQPSIYSLTIIEDGAGSEGEFRVVLSLAGVECTGLAQGGAAREATEGGHRAPHTPLGGCGARGGAADLLGSSCAAQRQQQRLKALGDEVSP